MNAQDRKIAGVLGVAFGIVGAAWLIYLAGWAIFGAVTVLLWGHALSMRAVSSADAELAILESRLEQAEERVRHMRIVP